MKGLKMLLASLGINIDPVAVEQLFFQVQRAIPGFIQRAGVAEQRLAQMESDISYLKLWAMSVSRSMEQRPAALPAPANGDPTKEGNVCQTNPPQ